MVVALDFNFIPRYKLVVPSTTIYWTRGHLSAHFTS